VSPARVAQISAQMLLNPSAGNEATFQPAWLRNYDVIPAVTNVYIMCDRSKGTGERSDRTAIVVIGVDQGGNKYLLDGVRRRMKLTARWEFIKSFKRKWEAHSGVQIVRIGYERYGMQVDLEVIEDMMVRENNHFKIEELNTPRQGRHSKDDRIERLEPDMREGRFYCSGQTFATKSALLAHSLMRHGQHVRSWRKPTCARTSAFLVLTRIRL
jgi:hypothetical protein